MKKSLNNSTLSRVISCIVLAVLLAATVCGVYFGIFGRNTQSVTIHTENGDEEQVLYRQVAYIPNTINQNWQEAIRPAASLAGGYRYILTADGLNSQDMKAAAKVLKTRAELLAGNAAVQADGNTISVTVPDKSYSSTLSTVFTPIGNYDFAVLDTAAGALGAPVMTREHVKQIYYSDANGTYQVQVVFNGKGMKVIQDLLTTNRNGTLYLSMDGQPAAYATLTTPTNDMLAFNASEAGSAIVLMDCMRSGALPAALTLQKAEAAENDGRALNVTILVTAAILLAACACALALGRVSGLAGVWTVIAWTVCFSLFTALISVSAGWIMTVPAMLAIIILCVASFAFGVICLHGPMGAQIKKGRGALAAYGGACRGQVKFLGIFYGIIAVVGLVLMLVYKSALYGVLGRIVLLGAALSFLALFVFLRVVLSCWAALTKK